MRLRETRDLLKKYGYLIEYSEEKLSNGDYHVYGLQRAINAIDNLAVLGIFDGDIKRLKFFETIYLSRNSEDKMRLSQDNHHAIKRIIDTAREKVDGYQKLISNSIPEREENVVSIKLPQYNDLNDLSKFFKELDNAMHTGLATQNFQDEYKLQNFDTGSLWIDIIMGSSAVVGFLGELITTAMNVKEKSYQVQITQNLLEQQLELQQSNKEQLEFVRGLFNDQMNTIVNAELQLLKGNKDIDTEGLNQMRTSVRLFADLINKGTHFYSPLNAPEEVKKAFPTQPKTEALNEPKNLLEQKLSYLEDNQSDTE